MNRRDVRDILKAQAQNTQLEFEQRTKDVILQFAEQGNNSNIVHCITTLKCKMKFYESQLCKDPENFVCSGSNLTLKAHD